MKHIFKSLLLTVASFVMADAVLVAQIIKRKATNFKAPVIYTLRSEAPIAFQQNPTVETNKIMEDSLKALRLAYDARIDSSFIKKNEWDSSKIYQQGRQRWKEYGPASQRAIIRELKGIRRDLRIIKNEQASRENPDYYKDRIEKYDTEQDNKERSRAQAIADSIESDRLYMNRIDSFQRKLDDLKKEQSKDITPSALNTQRLQDSLHVLYQEQYDDSVKNIEARINHNNDSIATLEQLLKITKDSAAYYRRMAFVASSQQEAAAREDSLRKKDNWFKRTFSIGSKKKETDSIVSVDTSIIFESASRDRNYEQQINQMNRYLEDIKLQNAALSSDYDRLKNEMNERDRVNRVIYERNNNTSVSDPATNQRILMLQNELNALRSSANTARNPPQVVYTAPASPPGYIIAPGVPESRKTDTVVVYRTDTIQSITNKSPEELNRLQDEISGLKKKMDSLRTRPSPAAVTKQTGSFNPSLIPAVSVFFKMGATTFGNDQQVKISRVASIASQHPSVFITLRGFTDAVGNPSVNTAIAQKRMLNVKQELVIRHNIPEKNVVMQGPVISSRGNKPNQLDRRVDIEFRQN